MITLESNMVEMQQKLMKQLREAVSMEEHEERQQQHLEETRAEIALLTKQLHAKVHQPEVDPEVRDTSVATSEWRTSHHARSWSSR